jgi:aspartate aminotransferase-like enzyme
MVLAIDPRLKRLFATKQHVLVVTASGSAAWQGAVRCGVKRRWACVTHGHFSERWHDTGVDSDRETVRVGFEWGEGIDPDRVADVLKKAGPVEAVGVVHNETSTGAFCDLPAVVKAIRGVQPDALIFVDAVSTLAGVEFEFDEWGIDVALASSQKCLALPPGICVVAVSDRFLRKAKTLPGRGYYFDFVLLCDDWDVRHQTPPTPAVNMFYALDEQLAAFDRETLPGRFERHRRMAAQFHAWAEAKGFASFVAEKYRSPTTANRTANGVDLNVFIAKMLERGHELSHGYGKLKGRCFRVGHFGDHTPEALGEMLTVADDVLKKMGR